MQNTSRMRTNNYLQEELNGLLEGPFVDMERPNRVTIHFGRKAVRRFGSIRMSRDKKESSIIINGYFKDEKVPEEVLRATIAHELCHYAHGFCSPLSKKYKYPHQGGVIRKEMELRGVLGLYEFEKKWTHENWLGIVRAEFPQGRRYVRRVKAARTGRYGMRRMGLKLLFEFLKP